MNWLRRHLVRVGDGSPGLFWELARRFAAGTWRERGTRALALLVVGWVWWQMLDTWAWLTGLVLLWWIVKAWRAADVEERVEEELAEAEEVRATAGQWRAAMVLELADTVRRLADGAQGVHLERVFDDWAARGLVGPGRTLSDFRRMCEHVGIPVRSSLKVAGVNRIGIHVGDLPDPSPTEVEDGSVGG